MELEKIPGYKEAIAQAEADAEALRDFAFTNLPADIAGLKVSQLTLRRLFMLMVDKSPFIVGGDYGPEHVCQFLWLVSLEYCEDETVRDEFTKIVSVSMPFKETVDAIFKYRDNALMDRPPSKRHSVARSSPTSFMAMFTHEFASAYGWDESKILDMPMARIYQLLRRITLDRNPKATFDNRFVDRVNAEYMKKAMELSKQ